MKHDASLPFLFVLSMLALPGAAQDSPVRPAAPIAGAATEDPRGDSSKIVLVEVDGRTLTLADAMSAFTSSHTGHGALVRGDAALRELVGRLVERELFLAEAEALGVPEEPSVVAAIDEFHRDQVVQAFWQRELTDKVQVSDEDVEAFYSKTDVALKLTLIETRERATCEALRARVVAGEDMSELASKESIHPSRSFGGVLPYVRRGEIDLGLEKDVFALETPRSLTPVLASEHGFAFARLEERSVNPTRLPREVALPQIRKILRDRVEDQLRAEIEARLEKTGEILIEEALLQKQMVLDEAPPDAIVSRSRVHTLSMSSLREALDLENLRGQEPETVHGAARLVARDWAMRQVIWDESEASGLREDPDIRQRVDRQRRETVLGLLAERYVYADVALSEEDLRKYYDDNKATSFTRPPERRLAYIVVATKAAAEIVLARYRAGEKFESLAKEASIDKTSALHGGRIGWIKKGDILPEVEVRAFAIEKGAVDGPIETPSGWFLVQVIEVKDAELVPYSGARSAVQKRLTKERQKQAWTKWATRLRERAVVRIDEDGMRAAVEWLARQPEPARKSLDPSSPHAPPGAGPGVEKGSGDSPLPEKKG